MVRQTLAHTLFILIPLGLVAEQTPTVDEIIARHIDARGGYERIQAIQTLVHSGGLYKEPGYTGSGDAFMAFRRPNLKVVGNPEKPDGYMEGWDGSAWEWFQDPGIVIRTVGAASGATRRSAEFDGPLIDYRKKGSNVSLGEPADIGGRPAYRLVVTTMDGFVRNYFIDKSSYLIVAERRSAPFHAFGDRVTTESRYDDYRPVAGFLFPFKYSETVIATGETLTEMQWGSIEANLDLSPESFSPPVFARNDLQRFLEQLFAARTDEQAVMWTYSQFRRFHPGIDTRAGVELIGYQFLKMGEVDQAITLLQANAANYPDSASSAFGLGRAFAAADNATAARAEYERASSLDPEYRRAAEALRSLE